MGRKRPTGNKRNNGDIFRSRKKRGQPCGVAIGLRGVLRAAWKKEGTHTMVSKRVLKIRMRLRDCYLTVIAVYALTSVDEEVESEKFYELLQDQIDEVSKKDFLIVLGDFNARVGPLSPTSRLHGPHNTDKRNQNWTWLVDLCNNNGLIITNTIFFHKNIHKWTWYYPSQKQGHTIDYVLINQQFRAQIYDTRASRKKVHISDHNIVITKISIKINKKRIHKNTLEATKLDYETNPKKLHQYK